MCNFCLIFTFFNFTKYFLYTYNIFIYGGILCGICGYVSKNKISSETTIVDMVNSLTDLNSKDKKVFINNNIAIASTKDSYMKVINNTSYIISFNGELYNRDEILQDLKNSNYTISEGNDSELVLLSYAKYNEKCLDMLNGIYSFIIYEKENDKLFLARDRLGIKPMYYSLQDSFIFSTEIKAILKFPNIKAKIGKDEICELFGLGPAHTLGKTFFKDIYEILPGHYAVYENYNFNKYRYWDLETKNISSNINEEITTVKNMVIDSVKSQSKTDKKICSMLSGGLDSSVLAYLANNEIQDLHTFSIDFEENDENFKGSDYQPTKDKDYVEVMKNYLSTNHTNLYFNTQDILDNLKESVIAKDFPGMADIDSSMLVFLKKIKEQGFDIALSGECSDEIFGGYPWYYKKHLIDSNTFPWSRSLNLRSNIINNNIVSKEYLESYVNNAYTKTCQNVVYNSQDSNENTFRKTCYTTIKWFMNTLIERTDRMCLMSGLDVRIPFADYKIFEYVYNLPYKDKLGLLENNSTPIEKYILRKAFEGEIPNEVIFRKKSPFPKTYDPNYTSKLEDEIKNIINKSTSPILELINVKYLYELLETHGKDLKENWFGQLMTYPQTLAYLIQINFWLEHYDIEIEI